jgi:hypothetical protein
MLNRDQGDGMPLAGAACWVAVNAVTGPDADASVVMTDPSWVKTPLLIVPM